MISPVATKVQSSLLPTILQCSVQFNPATDRPDYHGIIISILTVSRNAFSTEDDDDDDGDITMGRCVKENHKLWQWDIENEDLIIILVDDQRRWQSSSTYST